MGLTSWENGPQDKILKSDVVIAKNYLSSEELTSLGRFVNGYLELAEGRAIRKIPMTMEDWATRLDKFLEFDEREILQHGGKVRTLPGGLPRVSLRNTGLFRTACSNPILTECSRQLNKKNREDEK